MKRILLLASIIVGLFSGCATFNHYHKIYQDKNASVIVHSDIQIMNIQNLKGKGVLSFPIHDTYADYYATKQQEISKKIFNKTMKILQKDENASENIKYTYKSFYNNTESTPNECDFLKKELKKNVPTKIDAYALGLVAASIVKESTKDTPLAYGVFAVTAIAGIVAQQDKDDVKTNREFWIADIENLDSKVNIDINIYSEYGANSDKTKEILEKEILPQIEADSFNNIN